MKLRNTLKFATAFCCIVTYFPSTIAYMKFTNVSCITLDKSFVDFRLCQLKALTRNQVAFSMVAKLLQVPVNNVSLNVDVYKKANGYRPFFINITTDFCEFFRSRKRIPFGKLLMDAIEKYSNINHTCPYDHDIIVKDMVLRTEQMQLLPVPMGDYLLKITVAAYSAWKAAVHAYIQVREE